MSQTPLCVNAEYDGVRLDKFILAHAPAATFGVVQKLCRKGQIRLDGKRVKGNERVTQGQEVRLPPLLLDMPEEKADQPKVYALSKQEKRELEEAVLYEDDTCVVLNKPYGVPVQAGSGHSKSIDRMMAALYPDAPPKLVHRLDRDTTGVLLLAKGRDNAAYYAEQFKRRESEKTYWAIVQGKLPKLEGFIVGQLEKKGGSGQEKVHVSEGGKNAQTAYRSVGSARDYHWLEVMPKTGRTHQIRAHLSGIGVPLVGDGKYGGKGFSSSEVRTNKMFLHARQLTMKTPAGERTFVADMPAHFADVFSVFKWKEKDAESS